MFIIHLITIKTWSKFIFLMLNSCFIKLQDIVVKYKTHLFFLLSTKEYFCCFRLVYDRETGKPKGYGFCEYQDVETAQSAMRNLNNYDFNGRPLRVGVAAGEQNRDEMKGLQQALGGPIMEVHVDRF